MPMEAALQPVQFIKGVGPKRAAALAKLGIHTLSDLVYHQPRRFELIEPAASIADLIRTAALTADPATHYRLHGRIERIDGYRSERGVHVTRATVVDVDGARIDAIWFNQPYLQQRLRPGTVVRLTGKLNRRRGVWQLMNPSFRAAAPDEEAEAATRLPVYPSTSSLTQAVLRRMIAQALAVWEEAGIPDPLPPSLREALQLPEQTQALRSLHAPSSRADFEAARRRLAFEELFGLQVINGLMRLRVTRHLTGTAHRPRPELLRRFYAQLPYAPTRAQRRVISEILSDMAAEKPMHRLVQGDVGSGKTLVAAVAMLNAVACGHQAVMMAPTDLLARQHHQRLQQMLAPLDIEVGLLTGSMSKAERERTLDAIAEGSMQVVAGTQALLEPDVRWRRLTLVVTDEQHRFGVWQRALLVDKGQAPDVLVMTATPIPRTLAMAVYGDLDVSQIDELPPGRKPIRTRWLRPQQREQAYQFVRQQIAQGRQAYVVCPAVDADPEMDLVSAEPHYRVLRRRFPDLKIGLLHGQQPHPERQATMAAFYEQRLHLLVTTTVIEVGVDVPNATVMVIENADRFGLAQLHQLRGRVGRGDHASVCILIADPATEQGRERLQALVSTQDGFALAEKDLQLRGPGEMLGTRQHGLPAFKIADLVQDLPLLAAAQKSAAQLLQRDPHLRLPEHQPLRQWLSARYTEQIALARIGATA